MLLLLARRKLRCHIPEIVELLKLPEHQRTAEQTNACRLSAPRRAGTDRCQLAEAKKARSEFEAVDTPPCFRGAKEPRILPQHTPGDFL